MRGGPDERSTTIPRPARGPRTARMIPRPSTFATTRRRLARTVLIACAVWAGCGLAHAAPPATPVDANVTAAAGERPALPGAVAPVTGPQPLASDAPRVGPPPAGQQVADDYRIGPQDLIEIQVYGVDQLRREVRVNSRGVVSLPLIGAVTLGGMTAQEAEEFLTAKYEKDYLQNPQISLFIREFTSQRITLDGAVMRPGVYPIKGQTSLLQALAIAGGGAQMADLSEVMLFRGEAGAKKSLVYDVIKIRAGEFEDPLLVNDDIIVVKRSGARAALKDSLFRDILETINPFSYMKP